MRKISSLAHRSWVVPFSFLLISSFNQVSVSVQTGTEKSGAEVLRLRIRTDHLTYGLGAKIPIHVEITNLSGQDVIVGRDLWMNFSPSRVSLFVTRADGHADGAGEAGAADVRPQTDDLAKDILNWVILLSPGYSYGASTELQKDLRIGVYKVRALFESSGIDYDSIDNPLLHHPQEMEKFRSKSWKGDVTSNELTITIVPPDRKTFRHSQ
jgi:hypothetical protein